MGSPERSSCRQIHPLSSCTLGGQEQQRKRAPLARPAQPHGPAGAEQHKRSWIRPGACWCLAEKRLWAVAGRVFLRQTRAQAFGSLLAGMPSYTRPLLPHTRSLSPRNRSLSPRTRSLSPLNRFCPCIVSCDAFAYLSFARTRTASR